jgi:hypothetical protein
MKNLIVILILSAFAILSVACGAGSDGSAGKTIKSGTAGNNLTVTLSNAKGVLGKGSQDFTLTFTNASGDPVDVGSVSLVFHMPAMGSMGAMNNPASFTTTNTPGVYRGRADLEMGGEWQAQIAYEGPAGSGKATLPVTAQ